MMDVNQRTQERHQTSIRNTLLSLTMLEAAAEDLLATIKAERDYLRAEIAMLRDKKGGETG